MLEKYGRTQQSELGYGDRSVVSQLDKFIKVSSFIAPDALISCSNEEDSKRRMT